MRSVSPYERWPRVEALLPIHREKMGASRNRRHTEGTPPRTRVAERRALCRPAAQGGPCVLRGASGRAGKTALRPAWRQRGWGAGRMTSAQEIRDRLEGYARAKIASVMQPMTEQLLVDQVRAGQTRACAAIVHWPHASSRWWRCAAASRPAALCPCSLATRSSTWCGTWFRTAATCASTWSGASGCPVPAAICRARARADTCDLAATTVLLRRAVASSETLAVREEGGRRSIPGESTCRP